MASPIITAVRHLKFKESLTHTVVELAHKASIYGVVRVSNAHMGDKCHCSARTFQRHVLKLEQAYILRKTVIKKLVKVKVGDRMETRLRNEVNTYTFIIPWKKPSRSHVPIDTMSTNLPYQEREKELSLREELENAKKVLRDCTPGSLFWQWSQDNLTRLEGLLASSALPAAG
jgi:hypothetical protein